MNTHVRNQHYVPQFLLRNFSIGKGKFIWTYDQKEKYNNPIKKRAIKRVASEEFFYDQFKNNKFGSYEYTFQELENKAAPIINKIISAHSIQNLSIQEKKSLSLFVATLNLRTKGQLLQTKNSMNEVSEQLKQKAKIEIPKVDPKSIWFSMFENSKIFSDSLMNKVWMLCETSQSFYISDNPVVLQNTINTNKLIGNLGFESIGIEIYLPLSPSLTLCFFCKKLFHDKKVDDNHIENISCNSEHTLNMNSLQVLNSERFIFSNINNFDLTKRILNIN